MKFILKIFSAVMIFAAAAFPAGCSFQKTPRESLPSFAEADGTKLAARISGRYFEIYKDGQWQKLLVKGVNIGSALPGRWFTEFPADKRIYREWFSQIAAMNANTIRIYTLWDPAFYETLAEFNRSPGGPRLWILQEIWPDEDVPGGNLYDPGYAGGYRREIAVNIDALHGRADIPERRGRAWGKYRSDVSPYLLGVLIGRELLPEEVKGTNQANRGKRGYSGRFVRAADADPAETWLAEMCDYAVKHSQEKYGWQMPVAFVSWPTLDPMTHPTEFTPGSQKDSAYNDTETVNPDHLSAGAEARAGFFAAYHIYPNYPDFIYREPQYSQYRDDQGALRFGGYLRHFMAIHPPYPALVAEFGMSTSLGTAHLEPEGLHHGGVSEVQQGQMIARMMRAVVREGYAGGVIFEWSDEWAKKTWNTEPFMVPYSRHVFWRNVMDPEQNYGILAYEPYQRPFSGSEALLWKSTGGKIDSLHADADAAYLYLAVEFAGAEGKSLLPGSSDGTVLFLGIDTFGRQNGGIRLPVKDLPPLPSGVEFLLRVGGKEGASLLARPDYNRAAARFAAAGGNDDRFVPVRPLVNRKQVSKADGTVFPDLYADESLLRHGVFDPADSGYDSLAHWYLDKTGKKLHIRLPWMLLNVSDPSSNMVLHDPGPFIGSGGRDMIKAVKSDGMLFYAALIRAGGVLDYQPAGSGGFRIEDVKPYLWKGWDTPSYRARLKQSYAKVTEVFGSIN